MRHREPEEAWSPPRLLLFDIDGTLLLSRGRGLQAMHDAIQEVYAREPMPAAIKPHGKTDGMLFEEMALAYGLSAELLLSKSAELHRTYASRLAELLREPESVELRPGVRPLLELLARRPNVRLGLVTGNLETTAWHKIEAAGLAQFFETGGFGSDARDRSGLVAHALRRFAERTGRTWVGREVWVIGDTPDDVQSGKAHGTRTLAVATGSFDLAVLTQTGADVVVPDLSDTGAVVRILCDS